MKNTTKIFMCGEKKQQVVIKLKRGEHYAISMYVCIRKYA